MLGIFYHNKKVKSKKNLMKIVKNSTVLYTWTHTNKRTHIQFAGRVRT